MERRDEGHFGIRSKIYGTKARQEMTGQGSTGNVIAAICSFFAPGLGQLVQGRLLAAFIHFILAAVLWLIWMGWIIHLWSTLDAARFKPKFG